MTYFLYFLRCRDNSLYCGISTNPKRREREHNGDNKKASRYTRSRRPVKLVYTEKNHDKSSALKREIEIKKWNKKKKEEFIKKSIGN